MTKEQARELWDDYCEAATSSGSTESGAIELYDIEDMNAAAHALYAALLNQIGETTP